MGLAGARKRQKISHDPNNTTWARDTAGFGHKILAQQGWTPGSFLGARNAAQSSHFSAANASHIRVSLKDDNLGIGAKRVGETAENFGLGALVDIFGRLNGKDEGKMQKEQQARADLGARLYAEQRYGTARFVRGGFLVGDKIEQNLAMDQGTSQPQIEKKIEASQVVEKDSKRREKSAENDSRSGEKSTEDSAGESDKKSKRKRKEDRQRKSKKSAEKADTKKRKHKDKAPTDATESKEERRKRRQEKKLRKLAKSQGEETHGDADIMSKTKDVEVASGSEASTAETVAPTVAVAPVAPLRGSLAQSRQAVRRRYIEAKRMAGMNPQALREILMARS